MDPVLREAYNRAFSDESHRRVLARLETRLGRSIPFRVAETPLFLPTAIHERLASHARGIAEEICDPAIIAHGKTAIPPHLDAPGQDDLSACIQIDLAICRDADGNFDGKLVELQGFPSLYGLIVAQSEAVSEELARLGIPGRFTPFFGGLDRDGYVDLLRKTIVAGAPVDEVVLMDIAPEEQKTFPDFVATKELLGIDWIAPTDLVREGRTLYRTKDGKKTKVSRIFNRVVFDELEKKKVPLPFSYRDELDVTWVPHPNWYWTWSKHTLPRLRHPAVPRATLLSELREVPDDLSGYVLKPLFSFAGSGVIVDVTRADVDAVPEAERSGWVLQEKIHYTEALHTPSGAGVKAEVRMMFLRVPGDAKPRLVMNLVRLSRGKMLGVDQNRDLDWVGGTVGLHPVG